MWVLVREHKPSCLHEEYLTEWGIYRAPNFLFFLETRIPYIAKAGLALPSDPAVSAWVLGCAPPNTAYFFWGGGRRQYVYFLNCNLPLEQTGIIILESILWERRLTPAGFCDPLTSQVWSQFSWNECSRQVFLLIHCVNSVHDLVLIGQVWCHMPDIQHTGGSGREILSSRLAWDTQQAHFKVTTQKASVFIKLKWDWS